MIRESFEDVVIEPQRQALIPGFAAVRAAALAAGALGCSISGAGPTLFAWALETQAQAVLAAMRAPLVGGGAGVDEWIVDLHRDGARVVASG
jgi:homoserine kinase